MRLNVLGAFGSEGQGQRTSAFLVDDRVLVDAGTVGGALSIPEQIEITHALISHARLDKTLGLAFFVDTLAMVAPERSVTACGIAPVIEILRARCFNDTLWPDFTAIPTRDAAVLKFRILSEETQARVEHLWVTPVPVDHPVPTTGYIVHDGKAGFVYSGDTRPTTRLWQLAREMRGLKALVVDTAYPNRLAARARVAGHLTPDLLREEMAKMPPDLPIWVCHLKPNLYQETAAELARIDPARIRILEQGKTYTF